MVKHKGEGYQSRLSIIEPFIVNVLIIMFPFRTVNDLADERYKYELNPIDLNFSTTKNTHLDFCTTNNSFSLVETDKPQN